MLVVIAFNPIMLILLEAPLPGYALAPEWTPKAVARAKAWVARRGHHDAALALAVVGGALVLKGLIGLVS